MKKVKKMDRKDKIIADLKKLNADLTSKNYYLERDMKIIVNERDSYRDDLEKQKNLLGYIEGRESTALRIMDGSNKQLLEIIRWGVNSRTAEFPFRVTKSEQDDADHRSRYFGDPRCNPNNY